jgi:hypothetical protein
MANNVKARWLVSLSNGETAIEGKTPYEEILGELSPWQRLIRYIALNKLRITTIRIQVEVDNLPVRTFNLPSLSPKAKWGNLKPILPTGFNYFRRVEQTLTPESIDETGMHGLHPTGEAHFIEIHAYYPEFTLVTIVDEDTGNESWSLIIPKQ